MKRSHRVAHQVSLGSAWLHPRPRTHHDHAADLHPRRRGAPPRRPGQAQQAARRYGMTRSLWSTLVVNATFRDRPGYVWPGGHSWFRTSDPSLVRIATTTPPPAARPISPGQKRAGASTAEHHRAAASKVRSQLRSHLMIHRARLVGRCVARRTRSLKHAL